LFPLNLLCDDGGLVAIPERAREAKEQLGLHWRQLRFDSVPMPGESPDRDWMSWN
jgi:hypothetical protein